MLRQAWDAAAEDASTLLPTLQAKLTEASCRLDENVVSSQSNSHSSSAFVPSTNAPSDTETVRGWSDLIERFQLTSQFLRRCANYGLDAWGTFQQGFFPAPLPAAVNPAVTIDPTGRWADKADLNFIDPTKIVGAGVGDEAVYVWMLDKLVAVTQSRGDYSMGIIGRGGAQYT
jgi:hypothetical protein